MQHFVCIFVKVWHHLSVHVEFIVTVPIESCQKQVLTFHHIQNSLISLGLYVPKSERIQIKMFVWKVSFFLCHQTSRSFQNPFPFHSQNFKFYCFFPPPLQLYQPKCWKVVIISRMLLTSVVFCSPSVMIFSFCFHLQLGHFIIFCLWRVYVI